MRRRSCAALQRWPAPCRSGARLPWKRSSGMGPVWHSRHRPTWRLATMARPRAASPAAAPGSGAGIPSPATATGGEAGRADAAVAGPASSAARTSAFMLGLLHQAVVLQRQIAHPLAGGGEDGVEHRRRSHRNRRLADTAPEAAGRHDDRLHLRHLIQLHYLIGIEVLLLHLAVFQRALAVQRCR